jgi:hypothetical protein
LAANAGSIPGTANVAVKTPESTSVSTRFALPTELSVVLNITLNKVGSEVVPS